jgi:hypothetical protein
MKTSIKFATGLILAAAALVASGSAALAGEGGAAGSVSIRFSATNTTTTVLPVPAGSPAGTVGVSVVTPDVERLSTSVAVGKDYALATAFTNTASNPSVNTTNTTAVGAGGSFSLQDATAANAKFISTPETAIQLGVAQNNSFAASNKATLAPATGVTLAD